MGEGRIARSRRALRSLGHHWRQRPGDSFTLAYAINLSHRLPLLYLIVFFDLVLLSVRFAGTAPIAQVLLGPLLGIYAVLRGIYWMPARVLRRSIVVQRRDIDRMRRLGAISALLFAAWSLSLYPYGDINQRAMIHYLLAVTMFSGILGLAHSPQTALGIAAAFTIPSTAYFLAVGHPNVVYVSLVQLVVTGIALTITHGHHRDFVRLELARQKLARRERRTAQLATAHYRQATVDSLTGGMNRRAILACLQAEMESTGLLRPWLALVDLDGFKHVNDTYGHSAGDHVLLSVSHRIGETRGVIAHGRLGGDEFAILFDGGLDSRAVSAAARRLSAAIREPICHNNATLRLCASIGLHRLRGEGVSGSLERADAALYKAKTRGDGAIVLFSADDEVALQQRIAITRQFNDCALDDRLKLLYQPIYDLRESRVIGVEAFARWSPDGVNWQAPGTFMAIAEATGRTAELTRLVLARALQEFRPWENGLDLSINLCPRDVHRDGVVEAITSIVHAAGASPSSIVLEVTERALMDDPKRATIQLQAFREQGFRIALDDFGAGWSSLSQLRDLPLDMIKLDRALAAALSDDPGARAVAGMIVALAWQLGIGCTIEGIESAAQVEAARGLGINLMQGYHLGRPEPAGIALAGMDRAVA